MLAQSLPGERLGVRLCDPEAHQPPVARPLLTDHDHERYAEHLQRKIDDLGIRDAIRIVADRSTPETMYPDVDFTVHSSIDPEPFGRVVIEAMAFGRPIITAHDGGPAETVREGQTGFLADPRDPALVARRMVLLATDHALRARMGAAGRADVLDHFVYPEVLEPLLRRFV